MIAATTLSINFQTHQASVRRFEGLILRFCALRLRLNVVEPLFFFYRSLSCRLRDCRLIALENKSRFLLKPGQHLLKLQQEISGSYCYFQGCDGYFVFRNGFTVCYIIFNKIFDNLSHLFYCFFIAFALDMTTWQCRTEGKETAFFTGLNYNSKSISCCFHVYPRNLSLLGIVTKKIFGVK